MKNPIRGPLMPFTNNCWLWIGGTVIYMSIALHIVESTSYKIDHAEEHDESGEISKFMAGTEKHEHSTMIQRLEKHVTGMGNSAYTGIIGLAGGSSAHEPVTLPGRVITGGFAVFACIVLAAYTASSAAFLVNAAVQTFKINDLDEAFATEQMVCIRTSIVSNFRHRYPQYDSAQLLPFTQAADIISALSKGECVAAIIGADFYDAVLRSGAEERCGNAIVQRSLFSEANGMPVQERYAHAISFLIAEKKAAGLYNALVEDYKTQLLPARQSCEADGEEEEIDRASSQSLDTYHLLAPIFLSWTLTTVGVLLYYFTNLAESFSFIQKIVRAHHSAQLVDELKKEPLSALKKRAEDGGISKEEIHKVLDLGIKDSHNGLVDLILIAEEDVVRSQAIQKSTIALSFFSEIDCL